MLGANHHRIMSVNTANMLKNSRTEMATQRYKLTQTLRQIED